MNEYIKRGAFQQPERIGEHEKAIMKGGAPKPVPEPATIIRDPDQPISPAPVEEPFPRGENTPPMSKGAEVVETAEADPLDHDKNGKKGGTVAKKRRAK